MYFNKLDNFSPLKNQIRSVAIPQGQSLIGSCFFGDRYLVATRSVANPETTMLSILSTNSTLKNVRVVDSVYLEMDI